MSAKRTDHKLPFKARLKAAAKVRVVWDRKPQTKIKTSAKVYDRKKHDTFMDEKFKGL